MQNVRKTGGNKPLRRTFKRQPEEKRRQDLIKATMDCVCDGGLQAATVRNVAARAGVSNGLIRHYFSTKDQMIQAAYRATISGMTVSAKAAVKDITDNPALQLRLFISANLSPPVVDERTLSLWASFISLIHVNKKMAEIHREGYLNFRRVVEGLIINLFAEVDRPCSQQECERFAIKINASIDGLWLEGCLAHDIFASGELMEIGIDTVEAIIGVRLNS